MVQSTRTFVAGGGIFVVGHDDVVCLVKGWKSRDGEFGPMAKKGVTSWFAKRDSLL
jgi:hypothetical protein